MQDVPHRHGINVRQRIFEEIPIFKRESVRNSILRGIFFKDGGHLGQIESQPSQVGVFQRDLYSEIALRSTYIGEGLVLRPGKLLRDGTIGGMAQSGHRARRNSFNRAGSA